VYSPPGVARPGGVGLHEQRGPAAEDSAEAEWPALAGEAVLGGREEESQMVGQSRFGRRFGAVALVAVAVAMASPVGCGIDSTTSPTRDSLQFEASPPTGSTVVRGMPLTIEVTFQSIPAAARGLTISVAVYFERPDGVLDNSFMPGVPWVGLPASWTGTYPVSIDTTFLVPLGTPEGNPFIPSGSVVRKLSAHLSWEGSNFRPDGRFIGEYNVVDASPQ